MAERITPCAATPFKIITQWNLISRRHGTSRRGVGTRARRSSGPSTSRAEGGAGTSRANPARTPRANPARTPRPGPVRTPRANFERQSPRLRALRVDRPELPPHQPRSTQWNDGVHRRPLLRKGLKTVMELGKVETFRFQ